MVGVPGESFSGSGESSAVGSFDGGEGPVMGRARFLSLGTSDEQAPSVTSSEEFERPGSHRHPPSFELEDSRGPSLEAGSSEERGRSFDIDSSVERGQSFETGSSAERGQSFDIESSVERGHSFEIGSSLERGPSYEMQSSLDRGPSFETEHLRNKADTFQWGAADEPSLSESLGKEVSIEITGSDGLPVGASVERGSSYEDEQLLRTAEYLGGPAGGSLDLGSSAGESMDLGGSFESMEPPVAPPRSPRRGSPRSPSLQASPAPGMCFLLVYLPARTPEPAHRRRHCLLSLCSELNPMFCAVVCDFHVVFCCIALTADWSTQTRASASQECPGYPSHVVPWSPRAGLHTIPRPLPCPAPPS